MEGGRDNLNVGDYFRILGVLLRTRRVRLAVGFIFSAWFGDNHYLVLRRERDGIDLLGDEDELPIVERQRQVIGIPEPPLRLVVNSLFQIKPRASRDIPKPLANHVGSGSFWFPVDTHIANFEEPAHRDVGVKDFRLPADVGRRFGETRAQHQLDTMFIDQDQLVSVDFTEPAAFQRDQKSIGWLPGRLQVESVVGGLELLQPLAFPFQDLVSCRLIQLILPIYDFGSSSSDDSNWMVALGTDSSAGESPRGGLRLDLSSPSSFRRIRYPLRNPIPTKANAPTA